MDWMTMGAPPPMATSQRPWRTRVACRSRRALGPEAAGSRSAVMLTLFYEIYISNLDPGRPGATPEKPIMPVPQGDMAAGLVP
jgi:hypothetical protein